MGCQGTHALSIVQPLTMESRFAGNERSGARTETIPSVAAHLSDSKPNVRQQLRDPPARKKLLDVGFFVPTPGIIDFAKRYDASRQPLPGNVPAVFDQAGPVFAFHELLGQPLASTGFRHVENQQS